MRKVVRILPLFLLTYIFLTGNFIFGGKYFRSHAQAATIATFTASEDTYVKSSSAGSNYGTATTLQVEKDTTSQYALLRFNVSGIPSGSTVTAATFKIYVPSNGSNIGGAVSRVSGTWSEKTTTWTNKPAVGALLSNLPNPVKAGAWAQTAIPTGYVSGNGTYDFYITTTSIDAVYYASREVSATRPTLLVSYTTGGPSPTPTISPTPTPSPTPVPNYQPSVPIKGAFFYPWFPQSWTQNGIYPFTNYIPTLGYYDSSNDSIIDQQLQLASKAHLDTFIASWWGQGHYTDTAFQHILSRSERVGSPYQNMRWAIYYEQEGQGDPTVAQIVSDLQYLAANVFNHPGYLRVNDRPVVFVYADSLDGCGMTDRWAQARSQVLGGEIYLVEKVFPGYGSCVSEPESWHQYSPAVNYDIQGNYSVSVSPGFWLKGSSPLLLRDPVRFEADIKQAMANYTTWKLVTTWNEWGEGSSVEPASDWGNTYINILCRNFPGSVPCDTPSPTPSLSPTPTLSPTPSPTIVPGSIAYVSSTTANNGSGSTSLTINLPAGASNGNVMVAQIVVRGSSTVITPPSGWNLIRRDNTGSSIAVALYYKVAALPEASSYAWKFGTSQKASGGIGLYSGTDTGSPIDASSGKYNASTGTVTAPSVTTTAPGDMLLFFASVTTNATITPPSGMGSRWTSVNTGSTTSFLADQGLTIPGATGNKAGASSNSTASNIGQLVALRPAGGGPSPTPTPSPTITLTPSPTPTGGAGDPTVMGAGDIICDSLTTSSSGCQQMAASQVAVDQNPTGVLILGDLCHTPSANCFNNYFAPSWGRLFSTSYPTTGNHDYLVSGAVYYFDYWNGVNNLSGRAGDRGKGYYSYDLGTWHLIALNSQCGDAGGCNAGSPQYTWLQQDLANHPNKCTLAYYHIPLFSSGGRANNNMLQIYTLLNNNGVEIVLDGHDHIYERFAPQDQSGNPTPNGIREFIVGTGGANHTSIASVARNSEVRNTDTFGALKLTLHPGSYDWQFMPVAGKTFTDSGTNNCH